MIMTPSEKANYHCNCPQVYSLTGRKVYRIPTLALCMALMPRMMRHTTRLQLTDLVRDRTHCKVEGLVSRVIVGRPQVC